MIQSVRTEFAKVDRARPYYEVTIVSLERPQEFNRIVLDFLGALPR